MEIYEMNTINRSFFDGGGEAWMHHIQNAEGEKWHLALAWGLDGWDLGEYPYHVFAYACEGRMVAEYCEGDVTVWSFAEPEGGIALLDSFAEQKWRTRSSARLEDELKAFPEGKLPAKYRGPFSWDRLADARRSQAE
jgi:hypothetical protein